MICFLLPFAYFFAWFISFSKDLFLIWFICSLFIHPTFLSRSLVLSFLLSLVRLLIRSFFLSLIRSFIRYSVLSFVHCSDYIFSWTHVSWLDPKSTYMRYFAICQLCIMWQVRKSLILTFTKSLS